MKFLAAKAIRINKIIQDTGMYSRREVDTLIETYKVLVNGRHAKLGQIVKVGDNIDVQAQDKKMQYCLYYKPRGEVTGEDNRDKLKGMHPIGRLDKESEGLLIYTNDTTIVDLMLNPKNKIQKEYKVKIREKATPRVERILLEGVYTQEAKYAPVENFRMSEDGYNLFITLTEGKKHEIRRMLNALNLTIVSLTRIRIETFKISNMKPGQMRDIIREDFERFRK